MTTEKRHVFIIGSKGIPARYGGFETFVQELVGRRVSDQVCYHVACSLDESRILSSKKVFYCEGAQCFVIPMWTIGAAKAVIYDAEALKYCIYYIERAGIRDAVVYVLASRLGPLFHHYCARLKKLGAVVYLNPDGHEWQRAKWNGFIKRYWKISERQMVKEADLVICDSINIEAYIRKEYRKYDPVTCFLPYGAVVEDVGSDRYQRSTARAEEFLGKLGAEPYGYYLIVGRFVPENNYAVMLREFIASETKRKLIVITDASPSPFFNRLEEETHFSKDSRVIFPGTVYDAELLEGIRALAYAYLHGHSVGGTNPSLLEAMAMTRLNLLFDVPFNREAGGDAALYWTLQEGSLKGLIREAERMGEALLEEYGDRAKENIRSKYNWDTIINQYERLFLLGAEKGMPDLENRES